ncbi:pilus assembly protein TadG-related protein [Mameliella alba]|uniref:pilus assembly protein TadG-related protein n=2 Tax=Mameliella alba TaxID=561184 RepID=UPI0013FD7D29
MAILKWHKIVIKTDPSTVSGAAVTTRLKGVRMFRSTTSLTAIAPCGKGLRDRLRHFATDTSGNMSYLAIVGSLVMMIFGGVGVDMMHAELKRTKVQNTLDRAVLAAANIENVQAPEIVVRDYLTVMGLGDALTSVQAEQGLSSKRVAAMGEASIHSGFMSLIGVNSLDASGLAAAEYSSSNLEISMVLDVSGSMAGNSKIDNLRNAAQEFVDILMPPGTDTGVSISVVPYNATVNMGTTVSQYFTLDRQHHHSACAEFSADSFATTALSPETPLEQVGHFDPYSRSTIGGHTPYQWCRDGENAAILPHSSDATQLKTQIGALEAWGNTAIDVGMKWGTALLDPAARPAVQAMAGDGLVAVSNASRPVDFDVHNTVKYIVVMTDGENTTQYDLPDNMKDPGAMTGVWVNTKGTETFADDDYSVRLERYRTGSDITNYFPTYSQDISNIVFYFDTNNDGIQDIAHKIEGFPNGGPKDLDDFLEGAIATLIATDGNLTDSAHFMGASIKAGNTSLYYGVNDDTNGTLPDVGPTMNHETIPGKTHNYSTFDFTSWSTGTEIAKYYWTRTGNDWSERYQSTVDGLGGNPDHIHELNYTELYDRFGTQAAASHLFSQPVNHGYISSARYWTISQPYEVVAGPNSADARLDAICDSAKAQGIVVFAIGFEAPPRGLEAMANCASSPAHFFDVNGTDLHDTFAGIARTITQLRLTQ